MKAVPLGKHLFQFSLDQSGTGVTKQTKRADFYMPAPTKVHSKI